MKSENAEMETVFRQLSERNRDILLLVAKGMKLAQETDRDPCKPPEQPLQ